MGSIVGITAEKLREVWAPWIKSDIGQDEAGWFLAWCPRHSPDRSGLCDAEANFKSLRFRCNNNSGCHHGNSISLREPTAWLLGYESYSEWRTKTSSSKWAPAEEAIKALQDAHPRIEPAYLPTKAQVLVFLPLLLQDEKTIDHKAQPGWWRGWCPLHDKKRSPHKPTAYFNFRMGSYVCLAGEPCHAPKKGMSLINLKSRMDENNRG